MNVIVRFASSTVTLRISPSFWFELVVVVEDLDPVAGRDAQHVVLADRREPQHRRRDHLDDRDRDRAVVARPLERRRPGRAAVVDLDAVRLVLEAAVAAGRAAARTGRRRPRRRSCRWSAGRPTARSRRASRGISSSSVAQVALPAFGSRRTCHTVCVRAVVSTPTAISTRSGSSSEVTSRCQTSR